MVPQNEKALRAASAVQPQSNNVLNKDILNTTFTHSRYVNNKLWHMYLFKF